ncbi:tRNA1Val (adenine37-N6)-methyltransferase [Rheinheimera pacifica]|uniref:tRNA1(Val) (adenine(37)-N6)-methyltransferase n=1 Tax=Rheinheimera pacifica TaxID=173990 RepID=UPI0028638BB2|nr:methyltransferase [Rheinheimera pacifica]MDR6981564.1 tRNA1Val (adenine37-N6)-methyltransferase [Rheinheimera pacifica]
MSAGFQCKKFYVAHDQCAMKVGTDGLLLGAFAPLPPPGGDILDIGAGSGLISLMLAQRTAGANAIDAIELDPAAAEQAAANVASSPWPNAIRLIKGDILTYSSGKRYRLIVSNPPFFQQSLLSPDQRRTQARHTDSLPFAALLQKAAQLLHDAGSFALVLPASGSQAFTQLALAQGWQLAQRCTVFSKAEFSKADKPQRSLLCLRRSTERVATVESQLVIHAGDGSYSAQYQHLLGAFYLKFPDGDHN